MVASNVEESVPDTQSYEQVKIRQKHRATDLLPAEDCHRAGSIKVDYEFIKQLGDPSLGLVLDTLPPEPVRIGALIEGGLAESAGVKVGHVIMSINDVPVQMMSTPDILLALRRSFVKLGMWRERDTTPGYEITIDNADRKLGFVPEELPPEQVRVGKVSKWGAAHELGVTVGDVLVSINSKAVAEMNPKEFMAALKTMPLTLGFYRSTVSSRSVPKSVPTREELSDPDGPKSRGYVGQVQHPPGSLPTDQLQRQSAQLPHGGGPRAVARPPRPQSQPGMSFANDVLTTTSREINVTTPIGPSQADQKQEQERRLTSEQQREAEEVNEAPVWPDIGLGIKYSDCIDCSIKEGRIKEAQRKLRFLGDLLNVRERLGPGVKNCFMADPHGTAGWIQQAQTKKAPTTPFMTSPAPNMQETAHDSERSAAIVEYEIVVHEGEPNLGLVPGAMPPVPVYVDRLVEGGSAAKKGVRVGDILITVDGERVQSMARSKILAALSRKPARLGFDRGGTSKYGPPASWTRPLT
eukprot:gnl/MRDRNA2_/MRDRNA2_104864_c0_seq1.p1 gnl/MRDRNA2_/MRDRNA2_104864_c0~~gnl/MRDRNA2_/MRDRNA2_104864_c0_seq1.p1  ORF type:complete len:537 (-),score=91.25 gnl/MRDRNA2_/MRDRNA2_104864_c0_seq1:168-1736(-)